MAQGECAVSLPLALARHFCILQIGFWKQERELFPLKSSNWFQFDVGIDGDGENFALPKK